MVLMDERTPPPGAYAEGVGQNWPLASAGIAVAVAATFLEQRRGEVGQVR